MEQTVDGDKLQMKKASVRNVPQRTEKSMMDASVSILDKSRSYMGAPGEYGVHDYEFVACKVMEKAGLSQQSLKLIENEIVNQDCIASLYVVKTRKAIEAPERFYIFMEYCNGGDLKDLFEAKNYEVSFHIIQKIMRQLV